MPHRLSAIVLAVLLLFTGKAPAQTSPAVGAAAEWLPARDILMHAPSEELFWGVIHPAAALFERPFSVDEARQEHARYVKLLRDHGIRVHLLQEVLAQGTNRGPDAETRFKKLLGLARKSAKLDLFGLPQEKRAAAASYFRENLARLVPRDLARVIIQRPTVALHESSLNTGASATYQTDPLMNLYFMRDQTVTTAKGVIVCRMNSEQRAPEPEVVKLALCNLGINPILEVRDPGRLEGGDYLPAGETGFIGQGLRTNAAAIQQLLDARAFGCRRVVVVKDAWKNQQQMHLDTYFNIADSDLAVLAQSRVEASRQKQASEKRALCDVYELRGGTYDRTRSDADFVDYLEKGLGIQVIPVPDEDQKRYGINFLTIAPRTIIACGGQSPTYVKRLKEAGVKVTWVEFPHLTGGYGAAHCMTQVLWRCPTPARREHGTATQ
jgi:arginine deiminase